MGTCFSKKNTSCSPAPPPPPPSAPPATGYGYGYGVVDSSIKSKPISETEAGELKTKVKKQPGAKQEQIAQQEGDNQDQEPQVQVKKEVFVIKHRKSHDERGDRDCKKTPLPQNQIQPNSPRQPPSDAAVVFAAAAASPPQIAADTKTGACSESADDVDKVGKRVRTLSCNKEELDAILIQCGRLSRSNSSGSANRTRKYSGSKRSYDFDASDVHANVNDICNGADADGEGDRVSEEKTHRHSLRSRPSSPSSQGRRRRTPSRERNQQQRSSSRERRASLSPGKRSSSNANSGATATANANPRPGKMVSVPAAAINNGESATTIKRISVKRNVGSPRAQSPAILNGRGPNDGQHQPSLSRSSSRKAEQSPYRRNPLAEIDPNSLAYPQANNNNRNKREIQAEEEIVVKEPTNLSNQKPTLEINCNRIVAQGINYITSNSTMDNKNKVLVEEAKGQPQGKPQTLTRSRSSRRSRDLDIDPETNNLLNPGRSLYTSLLLQDIQNFHQQNMPSAVSLPSCVSKACSIVEAVADLNSATKSTPTDQMNKKFASGCNASLAGKSIGCLADERKDPFVESEVVANDDLMEPSFHKYVTVRRGIGALEDMEDQESSGSNSFLSGSSHSQQHNWGFSSSSWEPNSADSTDCWTSRSNTKEEDHKTPLSIGMDEAARRRLNRHQCSGGIGRGSLAAIKAKGLPTLPGVVAAASM